MTARIESWVSKKVSVRKCDTGKALFANNYIRAERTIVVFGGEILTKEEFYRKERLYPEKEGHGLKIAGNFYLRTPGEDLEAGDYVDHSCNPNCGMRGQIMLVAMRDIKSGEKITFDYAMTDDDESDKFPCKCGSLNCRKLITGNDWMKEFLQERYVGYFSTYIQSKIDIRKRGKTQ